MFRKALLATSALVFIASVSCSAAQSRAISASQMQSAVTGGDTNDEFLCHYGGFAVSASSFSSNSSHTSRWTHVAVPIVGRGQSVHRIIVEEKRASDTVNAVFHAGIRGSNRDGSPGKLIAGGTAKAPKTCGKATIQIAPTKLERNKTYWVEERVYLRFGVLNKVFWVKDPKSKRKAYEQYHKYTSSYFRQSSYTSPWAQLSGGPYVKVK